MKETFVFKVASKIKYLGVNFKKEEKGRKEDREGERKGERKEGGRRSAMPGEEEGEERSLLLHLYSAGRCYGDSSSLSLGFECLVMVIL